MFNVSPNQSQMQGRGVGSALAPDLSHLDLSSQLGAVQSSGGLLVEFFYVRVRVGGDGATGGRFETRLNVAIQPRGDRLTRAVRTITEAQAAQQFPAEWQAFKTYQDAPTRGTPLYELPGTSQSMIGVLVLHGIRSIEDLVDLPAETAQGIGLDAVTARNIAIQWTKRRDDAGQTINLADELARKDMAMAEMTARLAALEQTNTSLAATVDAMKSMGMNGAGGQQQPSQAAPVIAVQTEGYEDSAPAVEMFGSPSMVTGNDDLNLGNPLGD